MGAIYMKMIMNNMNCVTGVCSREMIYTIYVIDVKLCMMVLHIEFYLFATLLVTLTLFQGHSSIKQF